MTDDRALAFTAASSYAPKPNGSIVVYGLIASVLFGVAIVLLGGFYGFDVTSYPVLGALGLAAAFALGVWFRIGRKRRHKEALAIEHARLGPGPDASGV